MRVATLRLLTLTAVALVIPAGSAGHCGWYTTSAPDARAGPYYVDVDLCQPSCLYSAWVYEESNGIPGLQRGDEQRDDTCHGLISRDTIVF